GDNSSFINGMALLEDNEFLFILDLERILLNLEMAAIQNLTGGAQANAAPAANPMLMGGGMGMPPGGLFGMQQTAFPPAPEPGPDAPLILLAEDSPLIRQGVKYALQRGGYRVQEAANGLDAFHALERSLQGGEA